MLLIFANCSLKIRLFFTSFQFFEIIIIFVNFIMVGFFFRHFISRGTLLTVRIYGVVSFFFDERNNWGQKGWWERNCTLIFAVIYNVSEQCSYPCVEPEQYRLWETQQFCLMYLCLQYWYAKLLRLQYFLLVRGDVKKW